MVRPDPADVDHERALNLARTWGVEAVLGALASLGLVAGLLGGDALGTLVAAALAVAVVDRVRLRLDNRSLASAVEEAREDQLTAVRRGATRVEMSGGVSDDDRPVTDVAAGNVARTAEDWTNADGESDTGDEGKSDESESDVDPSEEQARPDPGSEPASGT